MNRIKYVGPSLVLAVMVAGVLLGGPHVMRQLAWAEGDARAQKARELLKTSKLAEISSAFREVGHVVEPSVVNISVARKIDRSHMMGRNGEMSPEDMFRRFFRDRFGLPEDEEQPAPRSKGKGKSRTAPKADPEEEQPKSKKKGDAKGEDTENYDVPEPYGNGSGWVYTDGKHIITNNHVVEGADEITVKFVDKSTAKATVVGTDPQTDIAVLKLVEEKKLVAAKLSKEPVEQGDLVFAFGSPFQFEFSMSQGIVSGTSRQLGILGQFGYENFIQTDAAINPGNSGGPLTNIYGEVIGMNSAIATRTGASNGLGFAIPADMILQVVDQLISKGKISRGYLGIFIEDVTEKVAKTFDFDGKGVLVQDLVDKNGPAAKAGVQVGDIITHINGEPVGDKTTLRRRVSSYKSGDTIKITVFRDGKSKELTAKLTEAPTSVAELGRSRSGKAGKEEADAGEAKIDSKQLAPLKKLGLENLSTLTKQRADDLGLEGVSGVLIEEVRAGSVAFAEGLRPGVIITEVQGKPVKNIQELADAVAKRDLKEGVRLRVKIEDVSRFIFLSLPE